VFTELIEKYGADAEEMATTSARPAARNVVAETVSEAIGQTRRHDPVLPRTGGPAGNARLTAWTGLVLLALIVVELITLINVSGLISWHIFVGTLLLPPALLKTGSTGWRIARYYTRDPDYRKAGPPPMLLRILGPAVVAATLGVLVSGLVLIAFDRSQDRRVLFSALGQPVTALRIHQGLFLIWIAVVALHVLGRFVPALELTVAGGSKGVSVDGGGRRGLALLVSLAFGLIAASLVLASSAEWTSRHGDGQSKREAGASFVGIIHGQPAVMGLGNSTRDGQTQTGTSMGARPRAVTA
jgi:hypothetical protein